MKMMRKKGKKDKRESKFKEPISEYDETFTYECPVRGKVEQVVKVKQYAYTGSPEIPMRW